MSALFASAVRFPWSEMCHVTYAHQHLSRFYLTTFQNAFFTFQEQANLKRGVNCTSEGMAFGENKSLSRETVKRKLFKKLHLAR